MRKTLLFILPIFALLAIWEIVALSGFVNSSLFPPPTKVAEALFGLIESGMLWMDLKASVWRLMIGLALGSSLGVVAGLATGRSKAIAAALTPIIQLFRPLPPVAMIPLIIIWFGIGDGAKIISIAFAVFFPVWINTHIGAEQIPRIYLWRARLLTSLRIDTITHVLLPASLPYLFKRLIFHASLPFIVAGIRIGIAFAFIMVFVSELAGASQGLGYRISVAHLSYRIDEMIAALVMLGALGAMTDKLGMVFQTHAVFPWLTVEENIGFGLNHVKREKRACVIEEHLRLIGMQEKRRAYPAQLSGGQIQRVALAQTLAHNPEVILMDEPYGALDAYTREKMQEWLLSVWDKHKKTVVFVTHSIEEAILLADRVLVLHEGKFIQDIQAPFPRPRRHEVKYSDEFNGFERRLHQAISRE